MSIVELLDYNIVPDGDLHLFLKKIGNSNSKSAIKKKKSNFMWELEHKFCRRQCKTTRIKKLDAVI
jgi:hypothetical protein